MVASIEVLQAEVDTLMQELRNEKTTIQENIREQFSHFNAQMEQLQDFLSESTSDSKI